MLLQMQTKDKRGISVMVGYVLLVTFAIIISVIVYNWMQSYVPQEDLECEDGVSLIIQKYNCDLEIENNHSMYGALESIAEFYNKRVLETKDNKLFNKFKMIDIYESIYSKNPDISAEKLFKTGIKQFQGKGNFI